MHRVLVVPWSIAAEYFAINILLTQVAAEPYRRPVLRHLVCCAPTARASGERRGSAWEQRVEHDRRERSPDERTDDRDPRVAPVRRALPRDRKNRVHDAWTEVSRRVDGVAGR